MVYSYTSLKEQAKSSGVVMPLVSLHALQDQLSLPKKHILKRIVDFTPEHIPVFVSHRTFGSQLVEDLYVTVEDSKKIFPELETLNN